MAQQKCRTWYSNPDRTKVYEWVAKNPLPGDDHYDLGIARQPDGSLVLEGDTSMMGNDVWNVLGKNFEKLQQQYSIQSLLTWASNHMGSTTQTDIGNGVVEMTLDVEVSALA